MNLSLVREALRSVEWGDMNHEGGALRSRCCYCDKLEESGHAEDCLVARALKELGDAPEAHPEAAGGTSAKEEELAPFEGANRLDDARRYEDAEALRELAKRFEAAGGTSAKGEEGGSDG